MAPPLPKFVDEKIAKGVLNGELRGIVASGDIVTFSQDVLAEQVVQYTCNGKRLKPDELQAVTDRLGQAFCAHKACIDVSQRRARKPLIPAKDYRYVTGQFIDTSNPGCGTVMAVRAKVFPRGCSLNVSDTPFSFHHHAAQRLLERLPEDKPRDPLATIGKAFQSSANFLTPAMRLAYALPNQALGVPLLGGLLLGEVRSIASSSLRCASIRIQRMNIDESGETNFHGALIPDTDDREEDPENYLTFRVKTYIGPRELRPEQRAFVESVEGFMAAHRTAFGFEGWMAMHGAASIEELDDAVEMSLLPKMDADAFEAGYADLTRLFADHRFLAAMGASGPLVREVESYRSVLERRHAEKEERLRKILDAIRPRNRIERFFDAEKNGNGGFRR